MILHWSQEGATCLLIARYVGLYYGWTFVSKYADLWVIRLWNSRDWKFSLDNKDCNNCTITLDFWTTEELHIISCAWPWGSSIEFRCFLPVFSKHRFHLAFDINEWSKDFCVSFYFHFLNFLFSNLLILVLNSYHFHFSPVSPLLPLSIFMLFSLTFVELNG